MNILYGSAFILGALLVSSVSAGYIANDTLEYDRPEIIRESTLEERRLDGENAEAGSVERLQSLGLIRQMAEIDEETQAWIDDINARFDDMPMSDELLPPISPCVIDRKGAMLVVLNFAQAPLEQLIHFYSNLAEVQVGVADGVDARISYRSHRRMSVREALIMIRLICDHNNVELVEVEQGQVWARWRR